MSPENKDPRDCLAALDDNAAGLPAVDSECNYRQLVDCDSRGVPAAIIELSKLKLGRSPWRDEVAKTFDKFKRSKQREWRADARGAYRRKKASEGKTVRPYKKTGLLLGTCEDGASFIRRKDRKRKKQRYHSDLDAIGRPVRAYTDLSDLSEEELVARKRQQNTLATSARRARKKQ